MSKLRALALFLLIAPLSANAAVRVCHTGGVDVMVDNTGVTPVSSDFQKCVDDTAVTVIDLPPGKYLVDKKILIKHSNLTIRTAQLSGNIKNCEQLGDASCAMFIASAVGTANINLGAPGMDGGMFKADNRPSKLTRVVFDHIILDGNKGNRTSTGAATRCKGGQNSYGFNASVFLCDGSSTNDRCEFTFNFTRNALCGTGLQWQGDFGRIQGNASANNGFNAHLMWSDGITVNRDNHGIINDNHIANNTDVALIIGEAAGVDTTINSNWIQQTAAFAYAGLMLGNFSETGAAQHPTGDYSGAKIKFNTIQCNGFLCDFGINLGPDPWSPDAVDNPNVFGGTVTQNNVSGAKIQINYGGAGNSNNKTTVTGNTLSGQPTGTTGKMLGRPGTTSVCIAEPNVVQNLFRNDTDGRCGNWVVIDTALPTSAKCLKGCYADQ